MHTLKQHASRLILLALGIFTIWFCWHNREVFAKAAQLSWLDFSIILLCYYFFNLITAKMACLLLNNRGTDASVFTILTLNCYASLLGYLTVLRLGYYTGKSYFYMKLYQLPVATSLGLMGLLSLMVIATTAILGVLLGLWASLVAGLDFPGLYWLLLAASLGFCAVLVSALYGFAWRGFLPARAQDWVAKVTLVFSRLSWAEAVSITVLSALTTLFQVIAFSVLFNGFGIQLPLLYVVFMAVFSNLSLIISLTPANLGVKELIIWMLVSHLDISAVDMISVMLVDRLLQILLVIGTCLAGYRSLGFIRSAGQPVEPESASGPQ